MSISLSTITGAAVTGLTSPTYTPTADIAPAPNGKRWLVTALGGTQTGVAVHSAANPFSIDFWKPTVIRLLGALNSITGVILGQVPNNNYKVVIRKGVLVAASNPRKVATIRIESSIPAGSPEASAADLAALYSCAAGVLNQQAESMRLLAVSDQF